MEQPGTCNEPSEPSQPTQLNSTIAHTQTTTLDLANNKFDEPVHPVINFPLTKFGKVSRSFQKKWYEHFPWLEYSVNLDAAFCFPCRFFISSPDPAFTSKTGNMLQGKTYHSLQ